MFRSKTVFVVGAGASCEIDFPSGPNLLAQISRVLDIRFDHQQISGDHEIMQAFRRVHAEEYAGSDINDFLHASWRIRDAAAQGYSIDNVIDQNDHVELVPTCAKIAIARVILKSESGSKIKGARDSMAPIALSGLQETWYFKFGQMLADGVRRTALDKIFENLAIISFNYDRSLEHFLPHSLVASFGLSLQEAQALVSTLKIFHPYGTVGSLPWQPGRGPKVNYGEQEHVGTSKLPPTCERLLSRWKKVKDLASFDR
jgi:hypothetical protein